MSDDEFKLSQILYQRPIIQVRNVYPWICNDLMMNLKTCYRYHISSTKNKTDNKSSEMTALVPMNTDTETESHTDANLKAPITFHNL